MTPNAIERLVRYVPREDHEHHCGFFFADDGACDCGLAERREDAAAVDALYQAAKDVTAYPLNLTPDAAYAALAAAVRRVEGE